MPGIGGVWAEGAWEGRDPGWGTRGVGGCQGAEGLEIPAGALRLLLSVILPSTETVLKGAGPEGIFFFF